jgi:hypothetical protein
MKQSHLLLGIPLAALIGCGVESPRPEGEETALRLYAAAKDAVELKQQGSNEECVCDEPPPPMPKEMPADPGDCMGHRELPAPPPAFGEVPPPPVPCDVEAPLPGPADCAPIGLPKPPTPCDVDKPLPGPADCAPIGLPKPPTPCDVDKPLPGPADCAPIGLPKPPTPCDVDKPLPGPADCAPIEPHAAIDCALPPPPPAPSKAMCACGEDGFPRCPTDDEV